jgi:hypothetical protein
MRHGELFHLTLDRLDRSALAVRIDRQLVESSVGLQFGPPKTPASVRIVPVPGKLLRPQPQRPLTDTVHVHVEQPDKKLAHARRTVFQ